MKKLKVPICATITTAILIPALFWIGGFDFNQRGERAVLCAIATVVFSGTVLLLATALRDLE